MVNGESDKVTMENWRIGKKMLQSGFLFVSHLFYSKSRHTLSWRDSIIRRKMLIFWIQAVRHKNVDIKIQKPKYKDSTLKVMKSIAMQLLTKTIIHHSFIASISPLLIPRK